MASIQLDFATSNFLIQEFLVDHPPEVERALRGAIILGCLAVGFEPPTAPGMGVELDWDAVRAHEGPVLIVERSSLRSGTWTVP